MIALLKKTVMWVVAAVFALFIATFSLSNRSPVDIDLWPLPISPQVPLFALLLACLGFGVLWGGFAAWLAAGKARKNARQANRRAEAAELDARNLEERALRLEKDLRELRAQEKTSHGVSDGSAPRQLSHAGPKSEDAA